MNCIILLVFLSTVNLFGADNWAPMPPDTGKKFLKADDTKGATKLLQLRLTATAPVERYTLRDLEIVESLTVTNWTVSVNTNQWTFDTKAKVFSVSNLIFGVQYSINANHPSAGPASVTLLWDASPGPNIAGYQAYVGDASRDYHDLIDAGQALTATFSDLAAGKNYFFAATAYDTLGLESEFSNEIAVTPLAGAVAGMAASPLRLAGTTDTPTNQFAWPPIVPRETYAIITLAYSNLVTGVWEDKFTRIETNVIAAKFWRVRSSDTDRAQQEASSPSGPWTDIPSTVSPGPAPGPAMLKISRSNNFDWINLHQIPEQ